VNAENYCRGVIALIPTGVPNIAKVGVEGSNPFARSNFSLRISMTSSGPSERFVASPPQTSEPGKHGGSTRKRNLACSRRRSAWSEPS